MPSHRSPQTVTSIALEVPSKHANERGGRPSTALAPDRRVPPPWLSTWLSIARSGVAKEASRADFTRGLVEGRVGFEPTTRGLKVSEAAVHGVVSSPRTCDSRAALVHPLHPMGPSVTAVAGSVAGSRTGVTGSPYPTEE